MKCAHPRCTCVGATIDQDGKKYCSQACASGGGGVSGTSGCGCGHAGCGSQSLSRWALASLVSGR